MGEYHGAATRRVGLVIMLILDHDPCDDRSDLLLRLLWRDVLCLLQASQHGVRLDLVTILYSTTNF